LCRDGRGRAAPHPAGRHPRRPHLRRRTAPGRPDRHAGRDRPAGLRAQPARSGADATAGLVLWLALAATARAQSLVDLVPEDPCARADALASDDVSDSAEHLRRACRLRRFDDRLEIARRQQVLAAEQARGDRIQRWLDQTQPPRVIRPFSVEGFLGNGLASYGITAAWALLKQADLSAWLGQRSISCDTVNALGGADCSRTSYGFRGRWYLMPTKVTPFLSGGLSITTAHVQIVQNGSGGSTLLSGDARANSYNLAGGIQIAYGAFRLSGEAIYEHAFFTGANTDDPKKTPNGQLKGIWSDSLKQDQVGMRYQVGFAF